MARDVRYFTEVDHHRHEALVALDPAGREVGVARFVQHGGRSRAAEVAMVVVDEWHRRGVGRRLLTSVSDGAVRITMPVAALLREPHHADELVPAPCCARLNR